MPIYHYEATVEFTPKSGPFKGQLCGDPYWFQSEIPDPDKAGEVEELRLRSENFEFKVVDVRFCLDYCSDYYDK